MMAHHDEGSTAMENIVNLIMDYESGEMEWADVLVLFGLLVSSGMAWTLQGSYGRTAAALIEQGYIGQDGTVYIDDYEGDEA